MSRVDSKYIDSVRYEQIQAEQKALEEQHATFITMSRNCPYCKLQLQILCQGNHGATYVKCPQCKERVFFPPVMFRFSCSCA